MVSTRRNAVDRGASAMKKYKIWTCAIVVPGDAELPSGFDAPPRQAALEAVERFVEPLACFSGWDGSITPAQRRIVEREEKKRAKDLKEFSRAAACSEK